jgi:hypothetical protein
MFDLNVDTYRQREQHWRQEGWRCPPSRQRDACFRIADGYGRLIAIIERHDEAGSVSAASQGSGSAKPSSGATNDTVG